MTLVAQVSIGKSMSWSTGDLGWLKAEDEGVSLSADFEFSPFEMNATSRRRRRRLAFLPHNAPAEYVALVNTLITLTVPTACPFNSLHLPNPMVLTYT